MIPSALHSTMCLTIQLTTCSLGSGMRRSSIYVGPRYFGRSPSDSFVPVYFGGFRFYWLWLPMQIRTSAGETHCATGVPVLWPCAGTWWTRRKQGVLHTMKYFGTTNNRSPRREKRPMTKSRLCSPLAVDVFPFVRLDSLIKLLGKWGFRSWTRLLPLPLCSRLSPTSLSFKCSA